MHLTPINMHNGKRWQSEQYAYAYIKPQLSGEMASSLSGGRDVTIVKGQRLLKSIILCTFIIKCTERKRDAFHYDDDPPTDNNTRSVVEGPSLSSEIWQLSFLTPRRFFISGHEFLKISNLDPGNDILEVLTGASLS